MQDELRAPGHEYAPLIGDDDKVIRGRDGWLFVHNDSNQAMLQHTGRLLFSASELRDWRLVLESRLAWLQQRGIPYFFLVAPDGHSVYPEKLPEGFVPTATRPLTQLIEHLESAGSPARLIYPVSELIAAKETGPVYSRTETHWNERGAFIAYELLMDHVGNAVPIRRLSTDEIEFEERVLPGDLGIKMNPAEESPQLFARFDRRTIYAFDNNVQGNGRRMEFECHLAPPTTCLFLGDSFVHGLRAYLADSFGRVVLAQIPTLDFGLVEEVQPDVVISIMCERFMISIPYDLPAPTLEELAQRKRAEGKVWGEPMDARPPSR